jgi:pimeloyl-ACP methyl ester carboxylesterase
MNLLPAHRPRRLIAVLLAVVTAIAAVVALAVTQPGAARAATVQAARPSGAKPTIVLEHGAWADGSSWDAVVGLLQQHGYTVDVPPNPLRSVPYDSTYLRDFLKTIKGPIVLVGHSYGSFVITNAATGDKQVKALVDVDGYLPAKGETLGGLNGKSPSGCVSNPAVALTTASFPGSTATDYDTYIKQSWFPRLLRQLRHSGRRGGQDRGRAASDGGRGVRRQVGHASLEDHPDLGGRRHRGQGDRPV